MSRPRPVPTLLEALSAALEGQLTRIVNGERHSAHCEFGLWLRGLRPAPCSVKCRQARDLIDRARAAAPVQPGLFAESAR